MRILIINVILLTLLSAQSLGIILEGRQDSIPAVMSAFLDANQIGMHVSNNGSLARDESRQYGYFNGLYYPLDSAITLFYSAGLWMTAQVDGAQRVAIAEYATEFAPGPYTHYPVDDSSLFKVYRISNQDGADTTEDWLNWPVSLGAPVDPDGDPFVKGEQSAWTVFNDGDTSRHTRRGGSTQPLGAEVQLYAYSLADAGWLDHVVFLEYVIINRSPSRWRDFIVGIWADPDVGMYADDFGGSDSILSLAYCYTLENDAELPSGFEPAVGVMLLESPSSATGGHPSGAANVLVNNYRSSSPEMTLDILGGRDLSGDDYVNPVTGAITRYRFTGDPRSGNGWLDSEGKGDRRISIASSPVDVAPGDTLRMTAAFIAASGESLFEAVDSLFQIAQTLYDYHNYGLSGSAFSDRGMDGVIHSVSFDPPEQLWFDGYDWGGSAFSGGVGWAGELWGTSLERGDNIDIEIVFSPDSGQIAASFAESNGVYGFNEFRTIPLTCRRLSDGAQLNAIFLDSDRDGCWSACGDPNGKADMLLILQSRYGHRPLSSYIRRVFPRDALQTDFMYAVSLTLRERYKHRNIRDGQRLVIAVVPVEKTYPPLCQVLIPCERDCDLTRKYTSEKGGRSHKSAGTDSQDLPQQCVAVTGDSLGGRSDTLSVGDVVVGQEIDLPLFLTSRYRYPKNVRLNVDPPGLFRFSERELTLADTAILRVEFEPLDTVEYSVTITALATELNMPIAEVVLTGKGTAWPLEGDLHPDGALDIKDLVMFVAYLFGGVELPREKVPLDIDLSGEVNIDDLILLANRIFRPAG